MYTVSQFANCNTVTKPSGLLIDTPVSEGAMATKITTEVWEHSQAKGAELLLLLALADYADSVHGLCWPAVQRLSMLIRMSERNTQYLLRKLAAHGHIAIKLRGSPRKTNLYQ